LKRKLDELQSQLADLSRSPDANGAPPANATRHVALHRHLHDRPQGSGFRLGCKRTIEEIGRWAMLDDAERQKIVDQLPTRKY
jgi:hypothetical protein